MNKNCAFKEPLMFFYASTLIFRNIIWKFDFLF